MRNTTSLYWNFGIAFVVFFAGIILGNLSSGDTRVTTSTNDSKSVRQHGYSFINPLLECEVGGEPLKLKYIPFEKKVLQRIKTEIIEKNPDTHLSVYFRNLENGPWFGINENEVFSPASLMKVPLLITYLKRKETTPALFEKKLKTIEVPGNVTQNIKPDNAIVKDKEYTINELIHHLIVSSDNIASYTLASYIPEKFLYNVYSELGIPLPRNPGNLAEDYISVKDYASFFRILYNASYLDRESSEVALKLLSETNYNDGLKKSLPKGLVVAHKFGERKIITPEGTINQLHDCGIVYYKQYPYLLCVMTKGKKELTDLAPIIQNTSKIVFDEVQGSYK